MSSGVTSGSRQLGRILVEQELLTDSGLQRALLAQKRRGGTLGDILVERGYVSRQQIEEALADANGREHVDPIPIQANVEAREEHYEVLGPFVEEPLHVSDSFLDATDFAFDLIEREDPHAVEIVRVREDERESIWSYSREASERYRDATARRHAVAERSAAIAARRASRSPGERAPRRGPSSRTLRHGEEAVEHAVVAAVLDGHADLGEP